MRSPVPPLPSDAHADAPRSDELPRAPRRRLRDRLLERDGTDNPVLQEKSALRTQLLLVDDDLREAALALGTVEQFLAQAADLLEDERVTATDLARLAESGDAIDRLEGLSETLTALRRRLLAIASQIR